MLAIEDSGIDAALLRSSFPEHAPPGSELIIADSVAAGVARIHERVPDIVLLDLHLPGGDGWDLMRRELDRLADSAVVLWTGDDHDAARGGATREADGPVHASVAMRTLWPSAFAVLDGVRSRARATDDILLVNDDLAENELLAEVLAPFLGGGRILAARSVAEAVTLIEAGMARREVPRLALVDLHLPRESGDALLERIGACAEVAAMRTVVVTGCATPALTRRCLALGAREVVIKPFAIDDWTRLLERIVPPPRGAA